MLLARRFCRFVFGVVLATTLFHPTVLSAAWPTETIATQTTASSDQPIPVALAYRRGLFGGRIFQERVFVAYHHIANRDLVIAARDANGLWTQSVVESAGDTGFEPDIAIDSAGNPHVVHFDSSNKRFRYVKRVGSGGNCGPQLAWSCETLPSPAGFYPGPTAKIAIATDGKIHVAFRTASDPGGYRFGYLVRVPGQPWPPVEWIIPSVVTPTAALLSLALDSAKAPHIAFLSPAAGAYQAFQWARKVNGVWVTEAAPGMWTGGGRMVMAGNGHPRACLNQAPILPDQSARQVHRGVRNTDGTWTISLHADDARSCDIQVEGLQSYLRIAHSSASTGFIYYSRETPLNPGSYFTLELVWAGTHPDLALDFQGKALIAFSYPATGTVFFAREP